MPNIIHLHMCYIRLKWFFLGVRSINSSSFQQKNMVSETLIHTTLQSYVISVKNLDPTESNSTE